MVFKPSEWVLKKVVHLHKKGKVDDSWKGPYIIDTVESKGAYFLRTIDGEVLSMP